MKKLLLLPFLFLFFAISCDDEINDSSIMEPEAVVAGKSTFTGNSFLVISATNKLPDNLAAQLATANGTLTKSLSEVGLAVVSSDDPNFKAKASKIKGIQAVIPNLKMLRIDPKEKERNVAAEFANPPTSGDDDFFFDLQWGHDAVDAIEAWNMGYRGAGARVAVLDGGFDLDHPDLVPNINMTLSIDITGQGLQYGLGDTFSHGTHTAGTIAAADNAFGTIGVAPEAELVLVKVLYDEGYGTDADVLAGMLYAVSVEADIISMSLGGYLYKNGNELDGYTAKDAAEYKNIYNRVATYAKQNGSLVIASAGNGGLNLDDSDNSTLIHLPSDAVNVISTSATAPIGWVANPPSESLDYLASYSNYGQSAISFAAPGGDFVYPGNESCTVGGITNPCWVFDLVFSTGNNGWYWSAGTSMATPHAAGVAALVVGKNGGSMKPAQLEAVLRASADDLGKPGKDDAYGNGRVNAFRAVSQ
jgi:subtilisin family serine protease